MAQTPVVDLSLARELDQQQVARAIYKMDILIAVSQLNCDELGEVAALLARLNATRCTQIGEVLPFLAPS